MLPRYRFGFRNGFFYVYCARWAAAPQLLFFPHFGMARKDLLDIASLNGQEIEFILDQSMSFKKLFTRSVKKNPRPRG